MNSTVRTIVVAVSGGCRACGRDTCWARDAEPEVHHRQRTSPASSEPAAAAKPGERKVLYYRNPMGLPDTSPVPKKDPMGMDYIAVYEGEDQGGIRYGQGVGRPHSDTRRAHGAGQQTVARTRRARRRDDRDQRARSAHRRAEVRGLDREAARQHDRASGDARPAAGRGLQPRTRVGTARVLDHLQRHEDAEWCGIRSAGRCSTTGHCVAGTVA